MALIKCPECENEISTLATSCPKCGYPISNEEIKMEQETQEKEQMVIDSFNEQVEENFDFRETYKRNRRCLITRIIVFVISLILLASANADSYSFAEEFFIMHIPLAGTFSFIAALMIKNGIGEFFRILGKLIAGAIGGAIAAITFIIPVAIVLLIILGIISSNAMASVYIFVFAIWAITVINLILGVKEIIHLSSNSAAYEEAEESVFANAELFDVDSSEIIDED